MAYKFTDEEWDTLSSGLKKLQAGPDEWSGHDWLSWSTLRSVLDAKAVRAASLWLVLVPILITFSSELPDRYYANPFGGKEDVPFVLNIPFNWYLLYFSAASFGLGRLIYVAYCPEFIRKYGSSASAASDGVTAELVRDYASDYLSSIKKVNRMSPEGLRLNRFLFELTGENNLVGQHWEDESDLNPLQAKAAGAHVREIPGTGTYLRSTKLTGEENEDQKLLTSILLWKFIDWLNFSKTIARPFCVVLVVLGFAFLAVPLIQGFWVVSKAFISQLPEY
ncbi:MULTISPECIES: hypothetical protein [unclassified Sulfitobacter]|uniref:hypothetical protein n=1 Tax=unclassified Sulfitobacter TaxID=196795 RepID=UPI0021A2932A|nr:hypothetical protein [Sulfitobacter sp. W074]UWR37661.1 hypothetical protein K3762_01040 [Sulfitobacter sp. W074]